MRGKKTLWLPGTDHAAIATQAKVEKELYERKKKTRHELGRDEFLQRVEEFAQESHDVIVEQLKKMGASLDWSREAFTLDETRQEAVYEAFKRMYEAKLIYRGKRIVNWDPALHTTVSDDEIEWIEEKSPFYYLKYGPFIIATARPETKFGDKYVVMHPNDARYANFKHGETVEVEWINGTVVATIIKDEAIDPEFGTGVMTITPWHDATDFDIASRHNLDGVQIIDDTGHLLPVADEFAGMEIAEARPKIVEKLKAKGLIEKTDQNYVHRVAINSRGGGRIEPQIKEQWFVDVNRAIPERGGKSLKELMRNAVASGKIMILPNRFEKIYFHWIDNLRDWCISRQIWYGHRIPVWYRKNEVKVSVESPGDEWSQDPDTLDTWFSSGLWTFSTLGWPNETEDLKTYHPTDVLETGYDILFFWVARMILMSLFLVDDVPFRTVYLHGIVRDDQGRKMSKSLGNAVDPRELINEFGADALRMAMIVGNPPGNDVNLGPEKVKAYKHFANKMWNATRFVLMNLKDFDPTAPLEPAAQDKETLSSLGNLIEDVTADMESFRLHLASEKLYHYFWHTFADIIIEETKPRLSANDEEERKKAQALLFIELSTLLKLLHPFMPFITEVLWAHLPRSEGSLLVSPWPRPMR
jgi:valyl-tRNA synthetase